MEHVDRITSNMTKILQCLKPNHEVRTQSVMDIVEKTGLNHITVVRYLKLLAQIQKEIGIFVFETPKTPVAVSVPTMKLVEAQLKTTVLDKSYPEIRKLFEINS